MKNWDEVYYFPKEIYEQADAISNCLKILKDELEEMSNKYKDIKDVHIVGSGDCYFIGSAATEAFRQVAHIEATAYEAYDYYINRPEVTDKTMVILISSSGKSLYVLKSAEYAEANKGIIVSLTNHEDTPLSKVCSASIVTAATGVSKTFPTKTTTSSLSVIYQLVYDIAFKKGILSSAEYKKLSNELIETVPDIIRKIYETEHDKIKNNIQMFLDANSYTFVGSGPCRSCAMIGAAKIVETSRKHVTFCNSEEYLHLHGFSVRGSDVVVVSANNVTNHRERQVVEYANDQCARILIIGNVEAGIENENIVQVAGFSGDLSRWGVVITNCVVLHLFANELAKRSFIDPDIPHDVDVKKIIDLLYTGPVAGWKL